MDQVVESRLFTHPGRILQAAAAAAAADNHIQPGNDREARRSGSRCRITRGATGNQQDIGTIQLTGFFIVSP